jgi:hypothetical protein
MVIDYSKWDNLHVSSSEDEDEAPTLQRPTVATSNSVSSTGPVATVPAPTTLPNPMGMSDTQFAHLPKIVLLVRSSNRDRILQQMIQNDVDDARPFGRHGISLMCGFLVQENSFCKFFPGFGLERVAKVQAALLSMTTAQYNSSVAHRPDFRDGIAGVPYDAQFRGDPFSTDQSTLHVRYGQERQALYRNIPGPEFKVCKMGASCGGPVVVLQARSVPNAWGGADFRMENIDISEADIPRVVVELLDLPKDELAY